MKIISEWFIIFHLLSAHCLSVNGKIYLVSTYGAYPNDSLDDRNGIQLAVDEAISSGLNSIIVFGEGIYNLSSQISVNNATNLTIIGQGIDKTYLIGNSQSSIFLVEYSQQLIISSLSIDYDPHPFTGGYTINVNETYLDLQVAYPHQTNANEQVQAIFRYNPIEGRAAYGLNTYEIYQTPFSNSTTKIISPGILRIPLNLPSKFVLGDPIVVRYAFENHVIWIKDSEDILIDSITIYSSWNMGLAATRSKRLTINNYHVLKSNQRWLSTNADCIHLMDLRDFISVSNSKCSSMGDDGLNVHATYFNVKQILNSTTIIVQTTLFPTILNVGYGTNLEFSKFDQPFTPYTYGTLIYNKIYDSNSQIFVFNQSIDVNVNDYVVVSDTPKLNVTNFTVENNRARGILLETRNILIENCIFNRTSGPAILFQPSLNWHEGPFAINVTLKQNLFINNNEGISKNKGVISILPDPIQLNPIIQNVIITSSTFILGEFNQGLFQSYNGFNISFDQNYIKTNHSQPFIFICNSKSLRASNNTLINSYSKIDQFFILDQHPTCYDNLTNFIDIPPSAFNSSFPPPVNQIQIY